MSIFEQAVRQKVRFNYKGQASVEDLFDIPLTALDNLFKGLNAELNEQKGESLLATNKSSVVSELELKIGLIKHVVGVRLAEQEARQTALANKERKQKILDIIADKQDEDLKGKSIEELTSLVNAM